VTLLAFGTDPAAAPATAQPAGSASSEVLVLSRELRVRLVGSRELVLEAKPWPGETLPALARRLGRTDARTERLAASLQSEGPATPDGYFRIPMSLLSPDERAVVLRSVFPKDRGDGPDWLHVARTSALPVYDEGLWQVAAWFTGDGAHFQGCSGEQAHL
jgi:hypothetical protein